MICVAIRGPSYAEAYAQIAQAMPHADLVELRLDYFAELDFAGLQKLKQAFALPMIFTFKGQEPEKILELASLNPDYIDLESDVSTQLLEELQIKCLGCQIIISYHDHVKTPPNLQMIYDEMQKKISCLYKIALTAHSTSDALRLMAWTKRINQINHTDDIGQKIIVVSMGVYGQISRLLQPVMGGFLTYACLNDSLATAPGQLTVQELCDCFNFRALNQHTQVFGLIGDPVDQSVSHQSHNDYMRSANLEAVYVKMPVKVHELAEFIDLAREVPFSGLSVTMPLKEAIMPYIDWIDPDAQKIGACNTLVFKERTIFGYNTDGVGALNAIEKRMLVKDKRLMIIGTGGAAKAIVFEACRRGAYVTVLSREAAKAQNVAAHFGCEGKALVQLEECFGEGYDVLINCTPVGMPIEEKYILPGSLVMDIRTKPKETELLQKALTKKCELIYGYEMFVEQAVGQFLLWFPGCTDRKVCQQLLEKKVKTLLK